MYVNVLCFILLFLNEIIYRFLKFAILISKMANIIWYNTQKWEHFKGSGTSKCYHVYKCLKQLLSKIER